MKNNGRQKAVYMALCVLAAIVVWVFVDNFGSNGGPNIESKWFRDIPITYTSETVLTGRGMMLLDEGTDATVDLKLSGTRWDLALLDKEELDACAVLRFDKELAALTAREFMERYLRDRLGVRCLVIGYDHHFGSSRGEGFVQYAAYGRELGIDVVRATALEWGGVTVSSSAVRRFLSAGNVEMARVCLGRAYELTGTVVHGREVGRSLGYPTANLRPDSADKMLPAAGVYAARIEPAEDGSGLPAEGVRAMVNVGCRPTIDDGEELTIEAHLFDFAGDLYGRRLRLLFERRLREERRFPSLDALRRQLDTDAARTLELTAP